MKILTDQLVSGKDYQIHENYFDEKIVLMALVLSCFYSVVYI
jgi:hypothetical protein